MLSAIDIVLHFIQVLDRLAIPYMLVGSFSSNYYGRPRQTMDADFVISVADLPFVALRDALGPEYHRGLGSANLFETVTGTIRRIVIHPAMVRRSRLSCFNSVTIRNDQAQPLQGAQERSHRGATGIHAHGRRCNHHETTRWLKAGNRSKDIEDVREVLAIQADRLDLKYIRQWCDQHGTRELLERLLSGNLPLTNTGLSISS